MAEEKRYLGGAGVVHRGDLCCDVVAQVGWIEDFDARTQAEDDEVCFPLGVELDAHGDPSVWIVAGRGFVDLGVEVPDLHFFRRAGFQSKRDIDTFPSLGELLGGRFPVSGQIEAGRAQTWFVEKCCVLDSRHAIGAESARSIGDQIPSRAFRDNPEGIDNPIYEFSTRPRASFGIDVQYRIANLRSRETASCTIGSIGRGSAVPRQPVVST